MAKKWAEAPTRSRKKEPLEILATTWAEPLVNTQMYTNKGFLHIGGLNTPSCQNAECSRTSCATDMLCKQRLHISVRARFKESKMSTKRDWHIRNVTWPPRPPALTPSDFFFWKYVKISVFVPPWPITLPELARWIPATAATDHRPCDDSRRGGGCGWRGAGDYSCCYW